MADGLSVSLLFLMSRLSALTALMPMDFVVMVFLEIPIFEAFVMRMPSPLPVFLIVKPEILVFFALEVEIENTALSSEEVMLVPTLLIIFNDFLIIRHKSV